MYVCMCIYIYVYNNNNNNIYLLQLGCYPVAGVILHVYKMCVCVRMCVRVCVCVCVCVCVIYECGCRPHNTTWWGASWRPMVYITCCSEMWNSAFVYKCKQF